MTIEAPPQSCKVYTPDKLAGAIVRAVGDEPGANWLEPSHGQGAFVHALADVGVPRSRIVAIDLDPSPSEADILARAHRGVDFITWAKSTHRRFDRIVGNPPYVSIGRLDNGLRDAAAGVCGPDGKPIGLGSNLWYAFVLSALQLLQPGGHLAFVLPSAAEYADYSDKIRAAVRDTFRSLELYRCRRPLFPDVQEGTVVAVARGHGQGPCRFRRREFGTASELLAALTARRAKAAKYCPRPCVSAPRDSLTLGDVAEIRLGGVTGDAKFFLMTESQRQEWELPNTAVTAVVTRARHLRTGAITKRDWEGLRRADERIWLFNPDDDAVREEAVAKRLKLSEEEGGCRRSAYKVDSRDPWYRTPLPSNVHGFISGMGSGAPWIAMNEMSGLNATNTLYVVTFRDSILPNDRFRIALAMLTSEAQRQLRRSARRYADGLLKHEPGALSRVRLPVMQSNGDFRALYLNAVSRLLAEEFREARQVADDCLATELR